MGRYIDYRAIRRAWPHGFIHITLLGDLPVGSGTLGEARLAARYLAKYVGKDLRKVLVVSGISGLIFAVFYGAVAIAPTIVLAVIFVSVAHLGGGAQWTLSTYGLQRFVPDRIRGRVFSFDFALVTLSIALSNLAAGWAADQFGPKATMVGLAAVGLVYAVGWWLATRRLRRATG